MEKDSRFGIRSGEILVTVSGNGSSELDQDPFIGKDGRPVLVFSGKRDSDGNMVFEDLQETSKLPL